MNLQPPINPESPSMHFVTQSPAWLSLALDAIAAVFFLVILRELARGGTPAFILDAPRAAAPSAPLQLSSAPLQTRPAAWTAPLANDLHAEGSGTTDSQVTAVAPRRVVFTVARATWDSYSDTERAMLRPVGYRWRVLPRAAVSGAMGHDDLSAQELRLLVNILHLTELDADDDPVCDGCGCSRVVTCGDGCTWLRGYKSPRCSACGRPARVDSKSAGGRS